MLSALKRLVARVRAVFRRRDLDRDFDQELDTHVAMLTEDNVRRGMSPGQARRAALLRVGSMSSIKEQHRSIRGLPVVEVTLQDARLAFRRLVRDRWFSLTAVATLAIGIGANTAVFTAVDAVLLKPLPYPQSEHLVGVWEEPTRGTRKSVSPGVFRDWTTHSTSFEALSVISPGDVNLTGDGRPERIRSLGVSAAYLDILRLRPALGRGFRPSDDQPGHDNKVVVLSHGLWQRRFAGDQQIIGRQIGVNLEKHTVVGVLPVHPALPDPDVEILFPYVLTSAPSHTTRENHLFFVIGRLKPTISVEQAQAELSSIKQRLTPEYPDFKREWGYLLVPFHEQLVGRTRQTLFILLGAVGFVLLIACANVANLLLARATTRRAEMAVRAALGAGRWRMARQTLTESVALSMIGGGLGLALAAWGTRFFTQLDPMVLPRAHEMTIDHRVLGFSFMLALATGLAFGLVPAFRATGSDLGATLRTARDSRSSGRGRFHAGLIVTEVALSLVLLTGAALLLQSLFNTFKVAPGFDPHNALVMDVSLPAAKYPKGNDGARFFHEALGRLEHLPGVDAAGMVTTLPMTGPNFGTALSAEPGDQTKRQSYSVRWDFIAGNYFRAMGIPVIRGRVITERDNSTDAPRVAVINDALAQRVFPGQDPLGGHVRFWGERWEVVGLVGSVRQTGLTDPASERIYLPQAYCFWNGGSFVLRGDTDLLSLGPAIRQEILALDADQPVENIRPLSDVVRKSTAERRLTLTLLGSLAGTGLLLAAIGLFGVMAYTVRQRVPEIGLRIALGARRADVFRLIVLRGLGLTLLGIGLGIAGSLGLTRLIATQLYGVKATDPFTFAAVTILLFIVGLLACWLPARRAMRIDPLLALRTD